MSGSIRPYSRLRATRVIALLTVILAVFIGIDYACYPYGAPLPGVSGDRGENGLWLRYIWYFGKNSHADEVALADHLHEERIRYAYFHVRGVQQEGKLRFRFPDNARRLTDTLHKEAPDVRVIAWIYAGNSHGEGDVNLSNPEMRRTMAEEARWLTTDCGFDGVQWDYEICQDGDAGLPMLLQETRSAMPSGKLLGVASALWSPVTIAGWGDDYYAKVAANCDQIAVMDYDSAMYLPRAYVAMTAAQVTHVCAAAATANPNCRVLIGVPTYVKGGASHQAHSENIDMALRGIRQGLAELTPEQRAVFAGIAPFADYTTTDSDWQAYRNGWLTR